MRFNHCPRCKPGFSGGIRQHQDKVVWTGGWVSAPDAETGEFAGERFHGSVSRLGDKFLADRAKVVFVFVRVCAVIFPIIPDRNRPTVPKVGKLLPDNEPSL